MILDNCYQGAPTDMLTGGIRHDVMRSRNRSLVIGAVRRAGNPSRTQIAHLTGLSHSTISAIAADLIAEGIMRESVHETQVPVSRRGRPQVALTLNPDAGRAVCLHLHFNRLEAVLVDYCGGVIATRTHVINTLALNRQQLIDLVVETVQEAAGGKPFMRIVFAVQGVTDAKGDEILWSPIITHNHVPFGTLLREQFGVPVSVQNDCNLIATALHWINPERYGQNFLAILLSHGIGMGLMLNGQIFTGIRSSGVEFGHMIYRPHGSLCRCGRRGCIEAYAGSYAIQRRAEGLDTVSEPLANTHDTDLSALLAQARAEDGPVRQAFREAGQAIGYGLGSLFALIDPAPVALIGHGTAAFEIMEPEIRAALAQTAAGQNAGDLSFEIWPDEIPLIQQGCAMEALNSMDHEVFGPGLQPTDSARDGRTPNGEPTKAYA
jgi:Transcriptional regulator/sugar kinase